MNRSTPLKQSKMLALKVELAVAGVHTLTLKLDYERPRDALRSKGNSKLKTIEDQFRKGKRCVMDEIMNCCYR